MEYKLDFFSSNVYPNIKLGDDCIAIKGGTSNVNISEIVCGPGHGIRLVKVTPILTYTTLIILLNLRSNHNNYNGIFFKIPNKITIEINKF